MLTGRESRCDWFGGKWRRFETVQVLVLLLLLLLGGGARQKLAAPREELLQPLSGKETDQALVKQTDIRY